MALRKNSGSSNEIKYEVLEECGSCKARNNGDVLKLRYMSWNDREPKYALRLWKEDDVSNERCGKGVG